MNVMRALIEGSAELKDLPELLRLAIYAGLRSLPDQNRCDRIKYFPLIPGEAGEEVRIHQGDHSSLLRLDDYL